MARKKPAPLYPMVSATARPVHRVTRAEWDHTMRAALAGLIASGERVGDGSYASAIMHARIYAETAHGERPADPELDISGLSDLFHAIVGTPLGDRLATALSARPKRKKRA